MGALPPADGRTLADRVRHLLGSVSELTEWPPVSIVMLNRNGRALLERVVPLLDSATDYPAVELVVVDNGSSDGSLEYLESVRTGFPVVIETNGRNVSFSHGCNQGAARAGFDHLLFMNNDLEPFESGWLREMVACLHTSGAAAVGARLLYGAQNGNASNGWAVQHQGVRFRRRGGDVIPIHVGLDAPALEGLGVDARVPAVTAACLLVERSVFEAVGGFTIGFHYGWEDVDLGLKLVASGHSVVCSGRAVLFHHKSATRLRDYNRKARRSMRLGNQRLLLGRWGPQLQREYARDRIERRGFWSEQARPAAAITFGAGEERDEAARALGGALRRRGWEVTPLERAGSGWAEPPPDADLVVVTDPVDGASPFPAAALVGWVLDDADEWLHRRGLRRYELMLASRPGVSEEMTRAGHPALPFAADGDWDARARELERALSGRIERPRFCIRVSRTRGAASRNAAIALAYAARREIEARGFACALELPGDGERLDGLAADVVLAIGWDQDHACRPSQINVLWLQEPVTRDDVARGWDLIAVEPALHEPTNGSMGRAVDRVLNAVGAEASRLGFPKGIAAGVGG